MCGTHFDMLHGVEITAKLKEKNIYKVHQAKLEKPRVESTLYVEHVSSIKGPKVKFQMLCKILDSDILTRLTLFPSHSLTCSLTSSLSLSLSLSV